MVARSGEKSALKRWLVQGGRLALTVLVTWFILDRMGLSMQELGALQLDDWRPDPLSMTASALLLLLMYFASAALWGLIVADLGGPRVGPWVAIRVFMVANLGRYLPGKVWQIAGLAALAKGQGVPAATATGAAILSQGLGLVAATTIGLGALLTGSDALHRVGLVAAGLMAVGVALAAVPSVFERVAGLWFRLARTAPPEGLRSAHGMAWLALSLVNWAGYALSFWLMVTSFGISVPPVATASAFAAAYVIGYLWVLVPAGIGVREGFLVAFLTPHMGVASATAMSVIARLWTTGVEVVPAAAFWVLHVRDNPVAPGATDE